jgi:hypothetical protein
LFITSQLPPKCPVGLIDPPGFIEVGLISRFLAGLLPAITVDLTTDGPSAIFLTSFAFSITYYNSLTYFSVLILYKFSTIPDIVFFDLIRNLYNSSKELYDPKVKPNALTFIIFLILVIVNP